MALREVIRQLQSRTLADLNAAHDYFTDTKLAWRIVEKAIKGKISFTIRNATGTVTTDADLVNKAQLYVTEQLAEATFQQFLSIFEHFFFDLLRLWLIAYPQTLASRQVSFKDVLDAPDKDAIASLVINKELNEILYKRPADWFAYLEDRAKLGCPTADEIELIAEAKASRDILAHNRGVANMIYEAKAGKVARYKDGERIDIPEDYHRATWELLRKVVSDLSNAASAKAP